MGWRGEDFPINNNGYIEGNLEHSNLISRQIAYKEIYQKHKSLFPLPFSKYHVHHRDRNKLNNSIVNLDLVTPEQHKRIHELNVQGRKELNSPKRIIKIHDSLYWDKLREIKKGESKIQNTMKQSRKLIRIGYSIARIFRKRR